MNESLGYQVIDMVLLKTILLSNVSNMFTQLPYCCFPVSKWIIESDIFNNWLILTQISDLWSKIHHSEDNNNNKKPRNLPISWRIYKSNTILKEELQE